MDMRTTSSLVCCRLLTCSRSATSPDIPGIGFDLGAGLDGGDALRALEERDDGQSHELRQPLLPVAQPLRADAPASARLALIPSV
jgi:hypothetical protein